MKAIQWWFAAILMAQTSGFADVSDAVVIVEGCSGVCVDSSGIVLTAKHCDLPETITVRFKHQTVKANRVDQSSETEGPVVFDCEGDGYPALPVAATAPVIGEILWSFGYPNLQGRRELRQACGPVLRWGSFQFAGGEFNGNVLGFACSGGWSGGPLLNAKGEVCGLLNSSNGQTSVFISSSAVRQAYLAGLRRESKDENDQSTRLPELRVFGTRTCGPCLQFKDDLQNNREFAATLRRSYELVWIDITKQKDMMERYAIRKVPVFLAENGTRIEGYPGPEKLLIALKLRPEPDPRPPPVDEPVSSTAVHQPPEQSPAESPSVSQSDAVDRLTSLTQHTIRIATWLGVTGISGGTAGAILGGLALLRTLRRRKRLAPRSTPPPPTPSTVIHDSPLLPQAIVPETRFAAYERDSHAEAFAWASAEIARKYPGAVSTLESIQGLINQYLASRGLKRPNKP
jgi:hypothetical protein